MDPNCWQPIAFSDGKGERVTPGCLTPHWFQVRPFGLLRPDQFLPSPLPHLGSPQLKREVEQVIALNAHLTLAQKALVESMRDGPRSTGQAGHWLKLAQAVSCRDGNTLD